MNPEEDYRQRVAILKALDVEEFAARLDRDQTLLIDSLPEDKRNDALLGAMHKARLRLPEMTDEERAVSAQWLQDHHLKPLGQGDGAVKH